MTLIRARAIHIARHVLPDDRLANVRVKPDGLVIFEYRTWHIHPALVRALSDQGTILSNLGVLGIVEDGPVRPPAIQSWMESGENLGIPLTPRILASKEVPLGIEMRVMRSMVDPALVREVNEEVLPHVCGLLIPVTHASP